MELLCSPIPLKTGFTPTWACPSARTQCTPTPRPWWRTSSRGLHGLGQTMCSGHGWVNRECLYVVFFSLSLKWMLCRVVLMAVKHHTLASPCTWLVDELVSALFSCFRAVTNSSTTHLSSSTTWILWWSTSTRTAKSLGWQSSMPLLVNTSKPSTNQILNGSSVGVKIFYHIPLVRILKHNKEHEAQSNRLLLLISSTVADS